MRSGGLRHRITIQQLTVVPDAIGYEAETWATVAEVWGELKEDKGTERLQNDRPISFRSGVVFMRYRSDITPKSRLRIDGIIWQIESVRTLQNSRRNEGLEITVRAND